MSSSCSTTFALPFPFEAFGAFGTLCLGASGIATLGRLEVDATSDCRYPTMAKSLEGAGAVWGGRREEVVERVDRLDDDEEPEEAALVWVDSSSYSPV